MRFRCGWGCLKRRPSYARGLPSTPEVPGHNLQTKTASLCRKDIPETSGSSFPVPPFLRVYILRGFIRAEAIRYDDLVQCGSEKAAKEKGLLRSEGKEYVVQEGDVLHFRFNVSK